MVQYFLRVMKKQQKSKFIVLFISFIMISSVFAVIFYGFQTNTSSLRYNNINFANENGVWHATIEGKRMTFDFHPLEVESIPLEEEALSLLQSPQIDFTYDVDNLYKTAIAEVEFALERSVPETFFTIGFTTVNVFNKPIFTCDTATETVPVIYAMTGNETKIYAEGNCIILEGNNEDGFRRLKDRLVYSLLDVI